MLRERQGVTEIVFFIAALLVFVARVPRLSHFLVNTDHCYQLAAGAELLRGRIPGVDVLTNFGPMIPLLAAATLRLTDNLVAEALLCALGWALAVWLVFRLARRGFGALAGWSAGIMALLLIARFHRWYVWLLPLAALAVVDGSPAAPTPTRWRWGIAGVICGLGTLFRPELGVGSIGVLGLLALADSLRAKGLAWPEVWLPLTLGFVAPVAAWAASISASAGPTAFLDVLREFSSNVSGSVAYWSKPPPPFRLDDPFSANSAHALTLQLLLWVQIASMGLGGWFAYVDRRGLFAREGRSLAAVGLMGLSFYPHTIYRADIHHLWQGIWPLLMGVPAICVLAARLARADRARVGHVTWPARALLTAAVLLAAVTVAGLTPITKLPHFDLAPIGDPPFSGIADLREGLPAAAGHPYAALAQTIDRLTQPSDSILAIYAPQMLLFAKRAPSGFRVAYERGIHDSPSWRQRETARLVQRPPPLVVAPINFYRLAPDDGFRASQPEMYDFVRAHYTPIGRWGNYILLTRANAAGTSP